MFAATVRQIWKACNKFQFDNHSIIPNQNAFKSINSVIALSKAKG